MNMNFILYLYRYMSLRMCVCKRIFWCMYMYMCMSCVVIVKAIQSYPLGWLWRHMNSGNRAGSLVYFFGAEPTKMSNTQILATIQPWYTLPGGDVEKILSRLALYASIFFHGFGQWRTLSTRETREMWETRETQTCAVVLHFLGWLPLDSSLTALWHLVRESNGNGFEDCKVEMCWAVQGCAGFVPRRCLWASARFTVRTLFHCDLMSVPWQRQIFELTNLYDFFKDPTKRKMKGMIIG